MLEKNFIPKIPFQDFKWKWACLQCTESLNDPVILLGVLFRMRKLEPLHLKYSSQEFALELQDLSNDISDSIGVNLAQRTGERNLIRNSGQYWRALGLIPPADHSGEIRLTEFGRRVADHDISQAEFAAITIQNFKLPNPQIQSNIECKNWLDNGIIINPLKLILEIVYELEKFDQGYITANEIAKIVVPLSACKAEVKDYVNFILWYRGREISLIGWPICCTGANDMRIVREFLLFLSNYGYLIRGEDKNRFDEPYFLNKILSEEIKTLVSQVSKDSSLQQALSTLRVSEVVSEVERKRIRAHSLSRPNQSAFRKAVLKACPRCIITNVAMPEVLEAAHIKPYKYKGEDTIANGFAMRTDIHLLFDTGHLRISEFGDVELSTVARMNYGALIPPKIVIPDFTNPEFLRWRWDNYNGM